MILELAIGDAYGAGFEYAPREIIDKEKKNWKYIKHNKYDLGLGKYTDDTQMSLAITELLLEDADWTPLNLANKFIEVFKRDPREGYAGRFYLFLQEVKTGEEFLARIQNTSTRSGAAMRATPIGFLPSIEKVKEYSKIQSAVTHNTNEGILSGQAAALMAHYFIHDLGKKRNLMDFVNDTLKTNWQDWNEGEVIGEGVNCVRAAITAIKRNSSLSDILLDVIDLGGDVDTVATIALGAASNSKEIKNDLGKSLIDGLENGKYGRDYILKLDTELREKFLQ